MTRIIHLTVTQSLNIECVNPVFMCVCVLGGFMATFIYNYSHSLFTISELDSEIEPQKQCLFYRQSPGIEAL